MPTVRVETCIDAPIEAAFDAARDLRLHVQSTSHTGERVVDGPDGLIGFGDTVTFEARHLGFRHRLSAKITECDPPHRFVDEMISGPFRRMRHVHEFQVRGDGSVMIDELDFQSPLGPLGWAVDRLIMQAYMRKFLKRRGQWLKEHLEKATGSQ